MINEIKLINTLPAVFTGMENDLPVSASEVWLREVSFSRPDYYMVEAESGTGKSSLCSYIYGSRGDYSGTICSAWPTGAGCECARSPICPRRCNSFQS